MGDGIHYKSWHLGLEAIMIKTKTITIECKGRDSFVIGKGKDLVLIAGPCAIESRDHSLRMAEMISKVCCKLNINWIFKACYDKDCRSSPFSFHGLGVNEGLQILSDVRDLHGIPVTSDFSDPSWAAATGEVCDMVQVPAYLCRQTSILRAAAETGKPVHLKKGQFMSPWNMKNSCHKLENFGNDQILLTDRGTFFGYNMLVNDMRSFPIMQESGYPVCYDATHSIQMPTSMGDVSGGQREFIPNLTRAATACGVEALFIEVHDDPKNALSDANTVLDLQYLEVVLAQAKAMHDTRQELRALWGEDNVHPARS
jgi:2-dehydro-3-deoxyphosphooctonate aldolase (KDO 8-P synthase)